MGVTSPLVPALVCLLACTSNFTHGGKQVILEEIIKTLNSLTDTKDRLCMELTVTDVLDAPKNTSEEEIFCRAAMVIWRIYTQHSCSNKNFLSRLYRNLYGMAKMNSCPVNETNTSTLQNFLGRLKSTMQKKYQRVEAGYSKL